MLLVVLFTMCVFTHSTHVLVYQSLPWVSVKARRLQDLEKLKKYVPIHKQGDVCPHGVPPLVERDNNGDDSDSE